MVCKMPELKIWMLHGSASMMDCCGSKSAALQLRKKVEFMAYIAMKRVLMVKLDKGFRNYYPLVNIGSFHEKSLVELGP